MITERTVSFGTSPGWALATLIGMGLLVLLLLGIAVVTFGFAFSKVGANFRQVWIAGLVALAGAGLLAWRGSQQLTRVGRIVVDAAGSWTLLSPVGRPIGVIPPDRERSLVLWAIRNRPDGGATSAMMHGYLQLGTGGRYQLGESGSFDVLLQLGYGPWWLDHPNITRGEEHRLAQAEARAVYVGEGEAKGLTLPLHTYDEAGIARVQEFLVARAR